MNILRQANEFKKQTSAAEKQYQSFDKAFNHDEKEELVKNKNEGHESSLLYNKKNDFIEFRNVREYMDNSLVSTYNNYLVPFKERLEEFKKFAPRKAKAKKKIVYNNTKNLYSILLSIYYNDYNYITDEEKEKMGEI